MLEGLNSAAAGMAAQQQRLDAVSNDLANANTTGYKRVRVGDDGRVDPRNVGVVRLENPRKEGDNLVTGAPAGTAGTGQVRAGALEASGSDAARSMVDMIASLRAFEAGQRVIHSIDETLAKSASSVGSVTG